MKKKNFLLTLLSVIMIAALAFPVFTALADDAGESGKPTEVTLINDENGVAPTVDSSWTNYELHITNTAKINKGDTIEFIFKGAFVNGKGEAVAKAYSIYVGTSLAASGSATIPANAADPVKITHVLNESYYPADIYFRYQYGGKNPCTSAVIRRTGVEEVEKNNFALIEDDELNNETKGDAKITVSADNEIIVTAKDTVQESGNYTARITKLSKKRLTAAMFNEGVITFDYKTTQVESFDLRLMNDGEGVQYGEYYYIMLPVSVTADGEWHTATVNISEVLGKTMKSTWGGDKNVMFDTEALSAVGFGLDKGVVTIKNVKASYEDKNRTITGLEIGGNVKTEYASGDKFDATDMEVKIVFSDGFKLACYDYTYDKDLVLNNTIDKITISWTYKGETYTADLDITVASEYRELKIKTPPTKTEYKAGDKFDVGGMEVVAVKFDGTEIPVTDYTYNTGMLAGGITELEIEYLGLKAKVAVTVAEFENKLSLTEKTFGKDGKPNYGWTAKVASKDLTSQTEYDKLADDKKSAYTVTPKDDDKGYYISAKFDSNNYATRIFEYGVADYKLSDLYTEIDYNAMISITYRTSSVFDKPVNFGLANFYDWNLGFHCADISSYIISDGEWHTMYFDIGSVYGAIDGTLWGEMTGEVNFNEIVGFAVKSQAAGSLDIIDVSVNWNGPAGAASAVDVTPPEYTYEGDMTINAKAGDLAPTFENEKAIDKNDGEIAVIVEWSQGAVTDGKLNAGTHKVKLYAKDAAGNQCEAFVITVNVEKGETPPESSESGESSGSENKEKKGCFGSVNAVSVSLVLLGTVAVYTVMKKKKAE